MIIDCHVHVAPDRIAPMIEEATVRSFGKPLAGSMTILAVRESMQRWGIDVSVVFNVAEKAALVEKANDFLIQAADGRRLVGMGTIHPELERPQDEVARLRAHGINGIKLHSLIQNFGAPDPRLAAVYEAMGDDMVAYFHAGKNPAHPELPALNTPESIARVKADFPKLKVVAAHFGGLFMLDEALKHIAGKDIYVDTSWFPGLEELDRQEVCALIKAHGADKGLFGTDYPTTSGVGRQIDWLRSMPLRDEEKEQIFWRNAHKLFRLTS